MQSTAVSGDQFLTRGSRAANLALLALFCAGFTTFALLYVVQPLLPQLAAFFAVSAAVSSLSISISTFSMAFGLLVFGALSEIFGRKIIIAIALILACVFTLSSLLVTDWQKLLWLRFALGLALSGIPAVAMAYVSEEFAPDYVATAMGLYVGGTALGGLMGRLLAGILSSWGDWRLAVAGIGLLGLAASVAFIYLLPSSKHFKRQAFSLVSIAQRYALNLALPKLHTVFLLAFVLMGCFIAIFNYVGFYLLQAPFSLSPALISCIFLVYLFGVLSANVSGGLVQRYGFYKIFILSFTIMLLGIICCAITNVFMVVLGLALFTAGYFIAHSLASGLVGRLTSSGRAQAAALYLFAYYMGSSILGYALGVVWEHFGWLALLGSIALLILVAAWRTLVLAQAITVVTK